MREQRLTGLDYLEAVTALSRRVRNAHPTKGLFEAADFQWWWRTARPTDDVPQLFWFDADGEPLAAALAIQWEDDIALNPILLPAASAEVVATVIGRALAHLRNQGHGSVEIEIDRTDDVLRETLEGCDFALKGPGPVVEAWLDAAARPAVSPPQDGYRLVTRVDTAERPHHFVTRGGHAVEERLRQTSLYRPDLDLVVLDDQDDYAAYGLFWCDPVTATGLVEPMRTEDAHQRRGLARSVLTAGIDRLAAEGVDRIKICFEPDNAAASHLYRSVGFEPVKETDVYVGPTAP